MADLSSAIAASRNLQSVLRTPPQQIQVPQDGFSTPRIDRVRPFIKRHESFDSNSEPFSSPTPIIGNMPASPFSLPSLPTQLVHNHPLTQITKSINALTGLTDSMLMPPPDPPPETSQERTVLRQKLLFDFTSDMITKLVQLIAAMQKTEDKAWIREVGKGWTEDDGSSTIRARDSRKRQSGESDIAVDGDQTIKPARKIKRGGFWDWEDVMTTDKGTQTKELGSPAHFTNGKEGHDGTEGQPGPTEWDESPNDGWTSTSDRSPPNQTGAADDTEMKLRDHSGLW